MSQTVFVDFACFLPYSVNTGTAMPSIMKGANFMELTNETLKAFKIIFCEYKRRLKSGFTKPDSLKFESEDIYQLDAFKSWAQPDIRYALSELKAAKYLKADVIGNIKITEAGLAYMQNRPREFFEDLSKLFDLASIFI